MVVVAVALIIAIGLFTIGVVGWSVGPTAMQWFGVTFTTTGRWLFLSGILTVALFVLALKLLRTGLNRDRERRRELKELRARERAAEALVSTKRIPVGKESKEKEKVSREPEPSRKPESTKEPQATKEPQVPREPQAPGVSGTDSGPEPRGREHPLA